MTGTVTQADYVVVGGGIAGVSCAEQLSFLDSNANIILISSSQLIKAVTNFKKVSRALETFDVEETATSHLTCMCPNVHIINATLMTFAPEKHIVTLSDGSVIHYNKLCLCTGASPKLITKDHPLILGIRDTQSVKDFQDKVKNSKRVLILGNGGIATELVYELSGCQVVWAIKDASIGHTFFDEGAAKFFLSHLQTPHHSVSSGGGGVEEGNETGGLIKTKPLKRMKYMLDPISTSGSTSVNKKGLVSTNSPLGSALGPDWSSGLDMSGLTEDKYLRHVHVEYLCECEAIMSPDELHSVPGLLDTYFSTQKTQEERGLKIEASGSESWPLYVKLSNNKIYGCDLVISATGVLPNTQNLKDLVKLSEDGGILVDSEMCSSCPDIYAAGDVCTVEWPQVSRTWLQMRLWSQARQMGAYSAKCMTSHTAGEPVSIDFCFELFAHVTKFFGYKVVLLGRYNSQDLGNDYQVLLRVTEGVEYVKVVLQDGRMIGAILIGETDLEETFENLILNQMDLTPYGESLLDPNIDIEDYFD